MWMATAAEGTPYLPASAAQDDDLTAALILTAHPAWSYRDLAETPDAVLRYLDAIQQARRRHKERNSDG